MKEHPILFSGPMVRAILDGRKTMTRRVVKCDYNSMHLGRRLSEWGLSEDPRQYDGKELWNWVGRKQPQIGDWIWRLQCDVDDTFDAPISNLYGKPGERLWVKEALGCFDGEIPDSYEGRYAADGKVAFHGWQWKCNYLPGMFMPRCASRITLEITGVRVERLQEISEDDAFAEGVSDKVGPEEEDYTLSAEEVFQKLWDSINGKKYPWKSNPWVWVIGFKTKPGAVAVPKSDTATPPQAPEKQGE